MSFLINAFSQPSRAGNAWFCAGAVTSYPDIEDQTRIGEQHLCQGNHIPGCRIFHVPREDSSRAAEIAIDEWKDADAGDAKNQVMVFKYKGKLVAVNHECPHSSYPLSNGTPFDIEDFGITLSSGITCPKHDWSFDMHTGVSDRGSYKLQVWEVQTRPKAGDHGTEEEVWQGAWGALLHRKATPYRNGRSTQVVRHSPLTSIANSPPPSSTLSNHFPRRSTSLDMSPTTQLNLRVATADDAAPIAQLVQSAFRHQDIAWTGPDTELNRTFTMTPEEALATITNPNAAFLMATTDDGALVGCMATFKKTDELARVAMLAVDPTLQAGGVGRRVLSHAEEYAIKNWGVKTLGLNALHTRELLLKWYEKRGYVRTGETSPFPVQALRGLGIEQDLYFVEMEKVVGVDA
ncbi:hypothetical protein PMIN03_008613 [Paraphaeosphaeria minitans]